MQRSRFIGCKGALHPWPAVAQLGVVRGDGLGREGYGNGHNATCMCFVGIVNAPFNTARLYHKLKINGWIILVQFVETAGN